MGQSLVHWFIVFGLYLASIEYLDIIRLEESYLDLN